MRDTDVLFGVSVPFVSSVENGKKNVPDGWYEILVNHYLLNDLEKQELSEAIEQSKPSVKIDLLNIFDARRTMAINLQRSFNDIDDETAKQIIELLNKKRGED